MGRKIQGDMDKDTKGERSPVALGSNRYPTSYIYDRRSNKQYIQHKGKSPERSPVALGT